MARTVWERVPGGTGRGASSSDVSTPHDDLDRHVRDRLTLLGGEPAEPDPAGRDRAELLDLFDAMAASRLIDIAARRLRERGLGYYTIGSAGVGACRKANRSLRTSRGVCTRCSWQPTQLVVSPG